MSKLFYLAFSLLLSLQVTAQLDSLERQLSEAKDWKEKLNAHQDLSSYYKRSDSSKVMQHINAMKSIGEEQNDDKAMYQTYTALASFYTQTSKYTLAQEALNQVYAYSLKMKDSEATSSVLSNLGILKYYTNELDSAKYFLDTAYQIKKTLAEVDSSNLSSNLNALAQISRQLYLFEDAVSYQMSALKIGEASGDHSTYLRALSGLAGLYGDLEENEKAFATEMLLHKKAIEYDDKEAAGVSARNLGMKYQDKEQLDSALYYFKIAKEQFDKIGYLRGLTEVQISFGDWYDDKDEIKKSIAAYQLAIKYAKEIEDDRLIAISNKNLGLSYLKEKDFNKAKTALHTSLEIFENLEYAGGIQRSYLALGEYYEQTNDWKNAYKYQALHHHLADSLDNEKFNEDVKSLEIKYETEIKDSEIQRQNLVIQNQNSKRKALVGYLGLSTLLGLATFFIMYQRIKKNRIIAIKNLELKNQKIYELKNENKILAMSSMIEGQEAERKRIAQDLHDGLGGILSTAKIQMQNIQKEISKMTNMNLISQAEKLIESAYSEVRRISHNMMPGALVNLGLFAAVEDLADQINNAGELQVRTQWYTSEEIIPEKTKVIVYRIIQEAVTNTLKYAKATKLLIQITENDKHFNLTIEDDGLGFDVAKIDINKSVGIKSIKSRTEYLNGELQIYSSPNNGTTYEIIIPLI